MFSALGEVIVDTGTVIGAQAAEVCGHGSLEDSCKRNK